MANKLNTNEHQINWAELGCLSDQELYNLLHPSFDFDLDTIMSDIKAQIGELFP